MLDDQALRDLLNRVKGHKEDREPIITCKPSGAKIILPKQEDSTMYKQSNGEPFDSMFAEMDKTMLSMDFAILEEHICGVHATLLLLDEVMPKEKKKPVLSNIT